MNRSLSLSLASLIASIASVSISSIARADDSPAAVAPPVAQPALSTSTAPQDRPTDSAPVKDFKSIALEANPLAATIGRYSLQVEWLPATHHAIVVNPHFDSVSASVTVGNISGSESFTGFGGELGYRYYTGTKGPTGLFIGPSLLVGHYSTSTNDQSTGSFSTVGGAFDIGGQAVVGPGIVIGAGFGLQYTKTSLDGSTDGLPLAANVIAGDGVRPRFLFTLGYAF